MKYTFQEVMNCNMCGSDARNHKILGRRLNKSQGKSPESKIGITTSVCKCSTCGLIYANPQPIPLDMQDHYGVPPEEYWKESYFDVDETYFQGEISLLKDLMALRPGLKSLDIGAGLGKQMIALSKAGFDTYGFEPSRPFYERAISKMGIPEDKLRLGMMEEMEYEAASFDFISFGAVLEHLYNPSDSIEQAIKWAKPEGLIHIEVPSSKWLTNKMINLFYRLKLTDYVGNISPMHEPYHLYEFGLESFKANGIKHGYEIAFYQYYVGDTFLPKVFDGLMRPFMSYTNTGMQLCVWLKKTV